MNKKTYVYVGGFEMPDKNAAALRVSNIGKILKKKGNTVVFVGITHEQNSDSDILKSQREFEGFSCYSLNYPKGIGKWIKYETDSKNYIRVIESVENCDGVIFYNFPAIPMGKLIKYCHKHNIRCYADVTEWNYFGWKGLIWGAIKGADTWLRMHIMHKKVDGMIVISKYLQNFYGAQNNVARIPILADYDDSKWENEYEKSHKELRLVYAGNAKKKDRLDFLIEPLMDLEREYKLDVIGVTIEEYLEYYPQHKQWLEKTSAIEFHGKLSHVETIEYIKKANYSCFFRQDDRISKAGFPTKFVEALCCGTPVITNRTSDLSEYIKNGKNGILIDCLNKETIKLALQSADYEMPIDLEFARSDKYENEIEAVLDIYS